jgi:hypothetical protein
MENDRAFNQRTFLLALLPPVAISSLFLFLSFLLSRLGLKFTFCLFKNFTGLPCPFCGSTRAALTLLHGDLPGALLLNPLGSVLILLAPLAFIGYHAFGQPRGWKLRTSPWLWIPLLVAIVLSNWIYLSIVGR